MRAIISFIIFVCICSAGVKFRNHELLASDVRPDDPKALAEYQILKTGQSLLIDCSGPTGSWCQQPEFTFLNVLHLATQVHAVTLDEIKSALKSNNAPKCCTNCGTKFSFLSGSLQAESIKPLAIVNRMDMADWNGSFWSGAQLRFIYSVDGSGTFSVEYELPAADWNAFQEQAKAWKALSALQLPASAGDFLVLLKQLVLQSNHYEEVTSLTLRGNRQEVDSTAQWMLGQWQIDSKGFHPSCLTNQIGNVDVKAYQSLWLPSPSWMPNGSNLDQVTGINCPTAIEPFVMTYVKITPIPPFPPKPPPAGSSIRARNILALQQCTLCHTTETQTEFQHIKPGTNQSVQLSHFLTGNTNDVDTAFNDLQSTAFSVQVTSPLCDGSSDPSCTRKFHDLARRKLFLAYLLSASNTPADIDRIRQFRVDFVH